MSNADFKELNPFVPGAGRPPKELFGREVELERMDRLIARTKAGLSEQGIILSGLRGVGKTVLLLRMLEMAKKMKLLTVFIEAQGTSADLDHLIVEMTHSINTIPSGKVKKRIKEFFSQLDVNVDISIPFFGAHFARKEESAEARGDLYRLETIVEQVARAMMEDHLGFILFVDELQEMDKDVLGALITIQHRLGQQNIPFFIVGAGLPNLPGVLSRSRSYAERLFEYRSIGTLKDAEVEAGYRETARLSGQRFTDEAITRLLDDSKGYPYFVQAYGEAAWNAASASPITIEDVMAGEDAARGKLDSGLYANRWQKASEAGKEYMRAMTGSGEEGIRTAEVAERLGVENTALSRTRSALIADGLIYSPARGMVAYTVPGMGDYIERHPDLGD